MNINREWLVDYDKLKDDTNEMLGKFKLTAEELDGLLGWTNVAVGMQYNRYSNDGEQLTMEQFLILCEFTSKPPQVYFINTLF